MSSSQTNQEFIHIHNYDIDENNLDELSIDTSQLDFDPNTTTFSQLRSGQFRNIHNPNGANRILIITDPNLQVVPELTSGRRSDYQYNPNVESNLNSR